MRVQPSVSFGLSGLMCQNDFVQAPVMCWLNQYKSGCAGIGCESSVIPLLEIDLASTIVEFLSVLAHLVAVISGSRMQSR